MKVSVVTSVDPRFDTGVADSVHLLVDSLSSAGHDATVACSTHEGTLPAGATAHWADQLAHEWASSPRPDVVHALGESAVRAGLQAAGGTTPVVATFLGDSSISRDEQTLANGADALLVLSAHEAHRWVRRGVPRDRIHVFHLPVSASSEPVAVATKRTIITDARGPVLESVIASMSAWSPRVHRPRLVSLSPLSADDVAALARLTRRRSALDDVEIRPGLRDEALEELIRSASITISTQPRRDGGLALRAARSGVPSIVVDDDPLNDVVVNGATGLVVPTPIRPDVLAKAVRHLLRNPVVLEGCGAGARRRVRAIRNADTAARQAIAAYTSVATVEAHHGAPAREHHPQEQRDNVERMVTDHLSLARQLASRYSGRGQALEDLVGVANLGLVKAAERYDPDHGSSFPSYAVPTILGELRRYFRDHAWAVRVPRTLQENALDVERAADDLRGELAGDATRQQVAEKLEISDSAVVQAQQTRREALSSASLDRPIGEDSDGVLGDLLGTEDGRLSSVEDAQAVRDALARLPHREREIVVMSFYGEQTQAEIAEHLGISQVHVSRTLARTLATLRHHVVDEVPLPQGWRHVDATTSGTRS